MSCTVKDSPSISSMHNTTFNMKYSEKTVAARKVEVPFRLRAGELTMIVIGLTYNLNDREEPVKKDDNWRPVGVVGTYYKAK